MVGVPKTCAADNPTEIRFIVSHADCSSGMSSTFEFFVSGTSVGVYSSTQGCECNNNPLVVTLNDPATLSLLNRVGCTPVSMTLNDPTFELALGFVRVEIDRTESGTEIFCLVDYLNGGNCGSRDLCDAAEFPGTSAYSNVLNCPDLLVVTPTEELNSSGYEGGPFVPASKNYTLTNTGPDSLDWTASAAAAWVTVSPANGSLTTGASVDVEVSINANANLLPQGSYNDVVTFTNVSSGYANTRNVALTVNLPVPNQIVCFTMDTNPGWTTEGQWQFGVPLGMGGTSHGYPDPTSGATGVNVYGVNLAGDYSITIGGPYFLTTGPLNVSGYKDIKLQFQRWLNTDYQSYVYATVEVSNNGSTWVKVWDNGTTTIADNHWQSFEYDISSVADNSSTVYLRWGHRVGSSGAFAFSGWNIDDICLIGNTMDNLAVAPNEGFLSSGDEGGSPNPFTPDSKIYTLTNIGTTSLNWTASAEQNWLDITLSSGTLNPTDSVQVQVSLNSNVYSLPAGNYNDTITFKNQTTGVASTRSVTLNVIHVPGEIEVTDSIPPVNDNNMPFGNVFINLSQSEHVTISNFDPLHELVITDIALIGGMSHSSGTPELSVALPAVGGGSSSSDNSYLPADRVNPPLPASRLEIRGGYTSLNIEISVLLLVSGDDPTILHTGLAAFPDISKVDYFNCSVGIPTLNYLSTYDVVVVMSNATFYDAVGTGNVLADYVDAGGKVIEAVATFATGGGWELSGRLVNDDYEPFVHGPGEFFYHSLGNFDNTHPIMTGVTALADSLPAGVSLKPQAVWVASWNNDTPLVATRNNKVVGVNLFALDSGSFSGDVVLLFHNAMVWLVEQGSAEFTLANVPLLPVTIPPDVNIVFDVIFSPQEPKTYKSTLIIESDDRDESNIEVKLSGTGIADYLDIVPVNDVNFCGHPGGPFLPSKTYYYLKNLGPVQIDWMLTCPDWLNADITSGAIKPLETTKISITPNTLACSKPEGIHTGQLVFTNSTTTVTHDRNVSLNIYTAPKIWFTPNSIDVTVYRGDSEDKILTIGNGGDGMLNFTLTGRQTGYTPSSMLLTIASNEPAIETKKDVAALAPAKHNFNLLAANASFEEGHMLVRFAPEADRKYPGLAAKNSILTKAGNGRLKSAQVTKEFKHIKGLSVVKLPSSVSVKEALSILNGTSGILYAEPDYKVKLLSQTQSLPNDPLFSELWGMQIIDAPEAWDIRTDASNIIVALLDTGSDYTHPDLAANMWVNQAEFNGAPGVDDDNNGYVDDVYGYDFADNDPDPFDYHGHGTHTAGTIGAIGNNGLGVTGVCWNVKIMALKVFPNYNDTTFISNVIKAMEYARDKGARVLSNSWGGGMYSQALKDEIDTAGNANQLFVAAAGNNSGNNDTDPHYPSSYDSQNIIAVLATDRYENMSYFSNYGPTSVDIGAPGSEILSCWLGGDYQYLSGTSMSTPHVSGAAALVWSICPSMSYQEVKDILLKTVDKIPSLSGKCVSEGRLNLFNAVDEVGTSWIEFIPMSGSLGAGQTSDVTVKFNGDVPVGNYQGQIIIASNDPYTPDINNIYVTMTVTTPDYFTELFNSGDNDLDNHTLTLMPENSGQFYTACIEEASGFPVNPAGGTILALSDDDYHEVQLQGNTVSLYDTSYDTFYIGSNGYITFVSGDISYFEQFSNHFALPRIAALFDDLNPAAGGNISYKQLSDRIAVTFENVPEFSLNSKNTFQIEMFFNGKIRITWLGIAAQDGLAGLSQGNGIPAYFVESDLSTYDICRIPADFEPDGDVDFADFAIFASHWLAEDCQQQNNWCHRSDFKKDGNVDIDDLAEFTTYWLENATGGIIVNQPPVVNAGPDQDITLPASAILDGTVTDDGLPVPPALTISWTKQSGPGTVTFGDIHAADTMVSFSTDGTYVLRLTANDGELESFDEITIIVNPVQPPPADYYVDGTNGNDNNTGTSMQQAWKTIQKAASTLTAGKTVLVLPGTYAGQVLTSSAGTSDSPINYRAYYENGPVVINATGKTYGFKNTKAYVILDGFEIRNANQNGILFSNDSGDNCIIRNCISRNNSTNGIKIDGPDSCTIQNCLIYDNGTNGIELAGNSDPTLIDNCTIYSNNNGDGIHAANSDTIVIDCIITSNMEWGIDTYGTVAVSINYSDTWSNTSGSYDDLTKITVGGNCINSDPLFVNPTGGDFHLQPGSPCEGTASDSGDMGYRYGSSAL